MKVLRLSPGSSCRWTCSAEITVPWMTSRSTPSASACGRQLGGVLRRQPHRDPDAGVRSSRDRARSRSGRHRRRVDPLQRGGVGVQLRQLRVRVLVAGPQALAVEHGQPAEPLDLDRGAPATPWRRTARPPAAARRRGRPSASRRHHPRAAGATRRHQGDLVQVVATPGAATQADLHCVGHTPSLPHHRELRRGPRPAPPDCGTLVLERRDHRPCRTIDATREGSPHRASLHRSPGGGRRSRAREGPVTGAAPRGRRHGGRGARSPDNGSRVGGPGPVRRPPSGAGAGRDPRAESLTEPTAKHAGCPGGLAAGRGADVDRPTPPRATGHAGGGPWRGPKRPRRCPAGGRLRRGADGRCGAGRMRRGGPPPFADGLGRADDASGCSAVGRRKTVQGLRGVARRSLRKAPTLNPAHSG